MTDYLAAMVAEETPLEKQIERDLARHGLVLERNPDDHPEIDFSGGHFRIVVRATGRVVYGECLGLKYGWTLVDVIDQLMFMADKPAERPLPPWPKPVEPLPE